MNKLDTYKKMVDLTVLASSIVSSTDLARNSAQILKDIVEREESKLIIKNNQPTAVLMNMEQYKRLMKVQEDYSLLLLAIERLDNHNPENDITLQALIEKEGFDEKELAKLEEEIEFE